MYGVSSQKTVQKLRTQISHLEHENRILMAEVKRLEQQVRETGSCVDNITIYS